MRDSWTEEEAALKLEVILDKAKVSGPQVITKEGKPRVVVVPMRLWESLNSKGRKRKPRKGKRKRR